LSLDPIVRRPDWQNMVARYPESGFESFRAYVNYIYLTGAPFKILVASMIGALSGFVGGVVSGAASTRTTATKAQRP